jgi:electron transfer flavoprotein beta subunit
MKMIVALKQVLARDSAVSIDAAGRWTDDSALEFVINEPDAYALEEALKLKEEHGGEVIVLCAGPERSGQAIREALAKGADRGIHIVCGASAGADSFTVAARLAAAVRAESPDLILCGLQSDDLGLGQTGVIMAELLGVPHATIIMKIEVQGGGLRVKRELESGWFQWIELRLPALLTIQSGISKLRYATLMGIKKAKAKPVERIEDGEPAAEASPVSLERVYLPQKKKETRILAGSPAEAAANLVDKLRFELRVI